MATSMMDVADPPYGSTNTIDSTMTEDSDPICVDIDLPWWADVIESTELADTIRSQCDEKVNDTKNRAFLVSSPSVP